MGASLEDGKLKLDIMSSMLGASNLNNDQWNHVAVSPCGSTLLSDCILYANGEVDNSSIQTNNSINTGNEKDILIGTNDLGNHFSGLIDEIRIYDRGLSAIEVRSIALNGTVAFKTSSTPQPPMLKF